MRLFGRDEVVARVRALLARGELVSLVGEPGGGLSAIARATGDEAAVARELAAGAGGAPRVIVFVEPLDEAASIAWLASARPAADAAEIAAIARTAGGNARMLATAASWLERLAPRDVAARLSPWLAPAGGGPVPAASVERALAGLADEDREALACVSAYEGWFDLADAEIAAGTGAMRVAGPLVDRGLVAADAGGAWTRFRVPGLVRAVVAKGLEAASSPSFNTLVARSELRRDTGRPAEAEVDARAALAAAATAEERAFALRALARAARARGAVDEARRALDETAIGGAGTRAAALVRSERARADVAEGHLVRAREGHLAALDALERLGAARLAGVERSYLGVVAHRLGAMAEAREWHEGALEAHRAAGNLRYEGAELMHLGYVLHEIGDLEGARARLEAAAATVARAGDEALEGVARAYLGRLAADAGEPARAREHLGAARAVAARIENARHLATVALFEAHLELEAGSAARAAELYAAAEGPLERAEVGFERLTAAYLAIALARSHGAPEGVAAALDRGAVRVASSENPLIHAAHTCLADVARGGSGTAGASAHGSSSDVRRAARLGASGAEPPLRIDREGRTVVLPSGARVDLSRKGAVRRVLVALARARVDAPSRALSLDELVAAGWPGERLLAEAAQKRAYTAIWALRASIFGERLLTRDDGYLVDPALPLRFEDL